VFETFTPPALPVTVIAVPDGIFDGVNVHTLLGATLTHDTVIAAEGAVTFTVAVALFVLSVTLVAVTVELPTTPGTVNIPAGAFVLHVTPAFAESFVTVDVNVIFVPTADVLAVAVAVAGLIETDIAGGGGGPPAETT
jgi:hypothetical protein